MHGVYPKGLSKRHGERVTAPGVWRQARASVMDPNEGFSDCPHPEQARQVMVAWDRFLRGADVPPNVVRNVIERSWSRCYSAGVDPECSRAQEPAPEDALRSLQHRYSDLVDASAPILAQSDRVLSESGTMMILTDPTGVI